jgi:hypothetical protein
MFKIPRAAGREHGGEMTISSDCATRRGAYTGITFTSRGAVLRERAMRIHLDSSNLVAIIAIALLTALLLAVRFRPSTWRGVVLEALIANLGAILAVLAFEVLTA